MKPAGKRPEAQGGGSALVCFAVKEEAEAFLRLAGSGAAAKILLTGIGRRNAEKAIRKALESGLPRCVLSCGFAGGLNPELRAGDVIFSADKSFLMSSALAAAGARAARFYCADRIASTAEEKQRLWQCTGADAVEMESEVIRAVCQEHHIPSATVRVISDAADEDLPLDFNRFLTVEHRLRRGKLALAVLKSPGKIAAMLTLQQRTRAAAQRLATVLHGAIGPSILFRR